MWNCKNEPPPQMQEESHLELIAEENVVDDVEDVTDLLERGYVP